MKKLALLMIALGPDASSTLLKRFEAKDAENICKKIADFPIVEQELQECVLDEFSELIESSVNSNLGGSIFAQKLLELKEYVSKSTYLSSVYPGHFFSTLLSPYPTKAYKLFESGYSALSSNFTNIM